MKKLFWVSPLLLLAGWGQPIVAAPTSAGIAKAANGRLKDFLGCLRQQKIAVVVAHRGGPQAEHPENSIATFDYTTSLVPVLVETDVQQTIDDVLIQNHDGTLDRTTTGSGLINDKFALEIAMVKQRDPFATPTAYAPPRLSEVLKWSKGRVTLFLDIKPRTDPALVAAEVKAEGLEGSVMALAYTPKEAAAIRATMPKAVLIVAAMNREGFDQAKAAGLLGPNTAAFVPAGQQGEALARDLDALGTTPMVLSFGGPSTPDAVYRSPADAAAYQNLVAAGARLIVSNRPIDAANALLADPTYATKLKICGVDE